jgi:hypothetical protein
MHPESLKWMTGLGWLLVLLAVTAAVAVNFLPLFDGYRPITFEFVIGPACVFGLALVALRIYRDARSEQH